MANLSRKCLLIYFVILGALCIAEENGNATLQTTPTSLTTPHTTPTSNTTPVVVKETTTTDSPSGNETASTLGPPASSPLANFDLGSFFGGFVLCAAIVVIIYLGCKMFRPKKPDYNTI